MRGLFIYGICLFLLACGGPEAQNDEPTKSDFSEEKKVLEEIYTEALTKGEAYENLRVLCKEIGHRLSGSENAEKAVSWAANTMMNQGLDTVWKQPCKVTHWERGKKEECILYSNFEFYKLNVLALGGSIGTGVNGIKAQVVEVKNFEELAKLGREGIEGKIVFYNRPMNAEELNTFAAYGGCVDQRSSGAAEAAPYGANAVLVRSMNLRIDKYPHTGVQRYKEGVKKIPAAAISTADAEFLSQKLETDPDLEIFLKMDCKNFPDAPSHNVVGEIRGSEFPEKIILVGGHLDSWDVGEGAHDDGAGVVQSMEVLRLFKALNIQPRHTIRVVAYMNEENGAKGAKHYAEIAAQKGEVHLAALESDNGGFTPRGFGIQADSATVEYFRRYDELFHPFYIDRIDPGYGGVDISFLKDQGTVLIGYKPDSQRYFIHHHAETDVFETVDQRELELGAAAMTSLIYLIDRFGVGEE